MRVPLRADWRFGGRLTAGSTAVGFDDSHFRRVSLPHCVVDLSWHGWDPTEWADRWIYRRRFDRPDLPTGYRLFLRFDGAMTAATVTVNGHEFERHLGGYLPFSYEITDLVTDAGNLVAVVIDGSWLPVPPDGDPRGPVAVDYLQPPGIYRDVALHAVPPLAIADVFAKPVDVMSPDRRLAVQCTLDGSAATADVTVDVDLRDGDRSVRAQVIAVETGISGRTTISTVLSDLTDIALWDVDSPHLYDVVATLRIDGVPTHELRSRIGFREARFSPDGFYLNGRRLKIFGLNRHQIYPYVGMAMAARVQRKDADIIRNDLNCNMVRCAHYPQSSDFLDACDELGLMVWEEPPGWQYVGDDAWQELCKRDVAQMVTRDRNHPSVVIWGVRVNESAHYPRLYARTREIAYELDGSRQTSGSLTVHSTQDWAQDVFAFDDYTHDENNALLQPPIPGVPYLVSEAVGALDGPHFYRRTDSEDTLARQAVLHAQVHDTAASDDRYAGLIGWLAFDYASQCGFTDKALKTPGVADTFRVPKPGAAFYQSQVDPGRRPVVLPAFCWDVDGESTYGRPGTRALIWSNCDRLDIFVADTLVCGTSADAASFGHLAYPPHYADLPPAGSSDQELRIDGYVSGVRVISRRFSPDRSHDRLSLVADDDMLSADGSDATRVVFTGVDAYGNPRPTVTGDVDLSVAGPGELIGDNPFSFTDSPGVGAIWLRTIPGEVGDVTLTAHHPVLGNAQVQIRTQ